MLCRALDGVFKAISATENTYKISYMECKESTGQVHLKQYLGICGRIMLKWIVKKQDGKMWTALIWLQVETSGWVL
jgi:hypothetical protein